MTQVEQTGYVPGVCNIGREEIARRRNFGLVMLAITIVLPAALVWFRVNPWWRLLVFLPAMMAASGLLQARLHFCSGFAAKGVFNFGSPGTTQPVGDEASKQKDRSRGNRITLYAALIGAALAIISALL